MPGAQRSYGKTFFGLYLYFAGRCCKNPQSARGPGNNMVSYSRRWNHLLYPFSIRTIYLYSSPGPQGIFRGCAPHKSLLVPPHVRNVHPQSKNCATKQSYRPAATGVFFGACVPQITACSLPSITNFCSMTKTRVNITTNPKISQQYLFWSTSLILRARIKIRTVGSRHDPPPTRRRSSPPSHVKIVPRKYATIPEPSGVIWDEDLAFGFRPHI